MNRGRPLSFIPELCVMHQSTKYSIPLQPSQFLPTMYVAIEDLQCSICSCIVDQQWKHPVEGMCVHFVLSIFFVRVMMLPHFRAFCKEIHEILDSLYPPVTEMVVKMLGQLLLTCSSYKKKEGIGQKNALQCSITHLSPFLLLLITLFYQY